MSTQASKPDISLCNDYSDLLLTVTTPAIEPSMEEMIPAFDGQPEAKSCLWLGCEYATSSRDRMMRHVGAVHLIPNVFPCFADGCNRLSSQRYEMRQHNRSIHMATRIGGRRSRASNTTTRVLATGVWPPLRRNWPRRPNQVNAGTQYCASDIETNGSRQTRGVGEERNPSSVPVIDSSREMYDSIAALLPRDVVSEASVDVGDVAFFPLL